MPLVFRRIGRKIIPIRVGPAKHVQDDLVNIIEAQKARAAVKKGTSDTMAMLYKVTTGRRSFKTGQAVAKRLAMFVKKGIFKKAA